MSERDIGTTENAKHDPAELAAELRRDLVLLFQSEVFFGNQPLRLMKKHKSLHVRYAIDGRIEDRAYLTPTSWRAKLMFDLLDGKDVHVLEMDRLSRLRRLFPKTLLRRLLWHARPQANFPPVARLYDPNGNTELLLTRSRLCGHGVDALHNLAGAPMFQPLWVSDLMALRPIAGLDLVRDEYFSATAPISAYIEAAAMAGHIVSEPDLLDLPTASKLTRLPAPVRPDYSMRLFDQLCKHDPQLSSFAGASIYDDYAAGSALANLTGDCGTEPAAE